MERGKVELPSQVPECNWHWEGDREYLCSGSHSGTSRWPVRPCYYQRNSPCESSSQCVLRIIQSGGLRVVGSSDASSGCWLLLFRLSVLEWLVFHTWQSGEWFEAQVSDRWWGPVPAWAWARGRVQGGPEWETNHTQLIWHTIKPLGSSPRVTITEARCCRAAALKMKWNDFFPPQLQSVQKCWLPFKRVCGFLCSQYTEI